ncbi:hypothetical protein BGW80DRAFT_1254372 [Lactifluus volemus]|nr:hypothetical protein BGW80DRAFT_1254372 [Lactifluus volemus]
MGNKSSHPNSHDRSSHPTPKSDAQPTLPTPQIADTASLQYSAVIPESSTASTHEHSVVGDPNPEATGLEKVTGKLRRICTNALGQNQSPSVPGPVPPLPPAATRPRAVTEAASSHRAREVAPDESSHRQPTSTVRSTLSDNFRFRILVVGKLEYQKPTPTIADINSESSYPDNRRLIVHEYPGFEPRYAQNCKSSGNLSRHALTQKAHRRKDCMRFGNQTVMVDLRPHVDLINGNIGVGVKEMLAMPQVPIVLVFTKYDMIVSQEMYYYEESCHRLLGKRPRDVPAEIVSSELGFGDHISKLVETTHKLIAVDSLNAALSTSFETQRGTPQISPVSLAFSMAQRGSKPLVSSPDFAGQTVKACLDIIHTDIVDVWNLRDPDMVIASISPVLGSKPKYITLSKTWLSHSPAPLQALYLILW